MKLWFLAIGLFCCTFALGQEIGLQLPAPDTSKILSFDWHTTRMLDKNLGHNANTSPISLKSIFTSPYNYEDELGFFCKWELQADKKTKQPIRLRLGSYDYVNHLEGKEYLRQKN